MTNEELQQLVEEISLTSFGQPFLHQAVFNSRLQTTGGRYHLSDHHLDFNPQMLRHGTDVFQGIIKHELCHYHLHLAGKGYQHQDREFKELLAQTGGSRYAPAAAPKKIVTYRCESCGQTLQRRRKIATKRYVCGNCRGKLKLVKIE